MKLNLEHVLKTHKIKITGARIAILRLFTECDKPQSADMIEKRLKGESINQVTIYRTIESFVKAGIIGRVDLRQGSVFYELKSGHNHHHHIICTKCGTLEDFESCQIETLSKKIISESTKFKLIKDHSFELFGICNYCLKNE